jgi:hypothetical protein
MTFILNDKRLLQLNDWFLYKESDEKTVKKMYKCGSITQECILVQHDRLLRYGMDMVSNIEINGMSGYRQTIIKTNNIHG